MRTKVILGGHTTPDRYFVDDRQVTRAEYDAAEAAARKKARRRAQGAGAKFGKEGWPRKSLALAVGPKARRRKEFYESSVRKGVPTQTDSIGRPIFTSQAHQRAYCKAYGKHQLNS